MYYSKQLTLQEELSSLLATSISTFYSEIPEFPLNITIIKYFIKNIEARKSTLFQCPRLSVSRRGGAYRLETISAHTIFITKWTEYAGLGTVTTVGEFLYTHLACLYGK